ncbi:GntR family transcriptional regulator [bacterium]|nr:GntR family transcriptional regulator [bacterium]
MEKTLMLKEIKIDKKSPIPRYHQVIEKIKEAIRLGQHKKGKKLPSERKLAEYFNVSRITIRKALDKLVVEGIIEKEWGKGIYIKRSLSPTVKKTKKIGFTIWQGEEFAYHPATLEILQGIGEVIEKKNYSIEIVLITPSMIKKSDYSKLVSSKTDGIILSVQEIPAEKLNEIRKKILHLIVLNRRNFQNTILIDFKEATYQIMEHLFSLGHRKIGLINGLEKFDIAKQVLEGYKEFLNEKGFKINSKFIKNGYYSHQEGFNLTIEILKERPRPTALILGDDYMALGALDAIKKSGLKCPDDISICSFNNFPFAKFTNPPLTTVKTPFYQLGKVSAQNLINLIEGKKIKNKILLNGELIIRESTKKGGDLNV